MRRVTRKYPTSLFQRTEKVTVPGRPCNETVKLSCTLVHHRRSNAPQSKRLVSNQEGTCKCCRVFVASIQHLMPYQVCRPSNNCADSSSDACRGTTSRFMLYLRSVVQSIVASRLRVHQVNPLNPSPCDYGHAYENAQLCSSVDHGDARGYRTLWHSTISKRELNPVKYCTRSSRVVVLNDIAALAGVDKAQEGGKKGEGDAVFVDCTPSMRY